MTTRGEPPASDVHRRTTWSLTTGKQFDDCYIDDCADSVLYRELVAPDNVRVELVMRDAVSMYRKVGADVSEVYCVLRIAQEAAVHIVHGQKLVPGWSLDLTRVDPATGRPWDLSKPEVQARVLQIVVADKPLFLIGSPPCTAFSRLQELSRGKRDPGVAAAELRAAEVHLRFSVEIYWLQLRGHRFFVHEHPSEATSWYYSEVVELACHCEVGQTIVDMCCHGMVVDTGPLQGPARKRTKMLSNSQEVLKRVEAHCPNGLPDKSLHHVHVPLKSGRAKRCQIYPRAFCRLVVEGIAAEKKLSPRIKGRTVDEP